MGKKIYKQIIIAISVILLILLLITYPLIPIKTCKTVTGIEYDCHINVTSVYQILLDKW